MCFFPSFFGRFQDSFTAQMPGLCISWLVAGGLLYTGGVPFFMLADYRPLCH
jgi:predicted membrane channel-forming protein YqfA (hemolysin III family)